MTTSQLHSVIAMVEARSTDRESYLHGPQHWRCVSLLGIRLARVTEGADPFVAFLFGLFHDAIRENDDHDPEHGARGAALFQEFAAKGRLSATPEQQDQIVHACHWHTTASPTDCAPVGVCYDADRLTLWRVGKAPSAPYLSTSAGKEMAYSGATKEMHGTPLEWDDVLHELLQRKDPIV